MARQMSTFKLQEKSVRLNCTKWQGKSVRLNGKTKVRLNGKTKVYV